jgi:hypothetical protein
LRLLQDDNHNNAIITSILLLTDFVKYVFLIIF